MIVRLKPFLVAMACCTIGDLCHAEQLAGTYLLDVGIGSPKSHLARRLGKGGYELSDASYQGFQDWYSVQRPAITALFMTEINQNMAVVWGASTRERGAKYHIQPALQLGVIVQSEITKGTFLSAGITTIWAGDFVERSCTADYGPIAGVQQVNCRLAAGLLPPQETLNYLITDPGWSESRLTLRLEKRF